MGDVSSTRNYLIGSKGSGQLADPDQYLGLLDDALVVTHDGGGGGGGTPPLTDTATATVETVPVSHVGDAAHDPAIWPHPTDPAKSLVIGNDKEGALDVYDLDLGSWCSGSPRASSATWTFGPGAVGTQTRDLVAVWRAGLRLYSVNPTTRQLTNVTDGWAAASLFPQAERDCACIESRAEGPRRSSSHETEQWRSNVLDGRMAIRWWTPPRVARGHSDPKRRAALPTTSAALSSRRRT